jgi:signal peptidase I
MLALLAAWRLGPWAIEGWARGYEALVAIPLAVLVVPAVGHAMRRLNDLGWAGGWAWVLVLPWLRWGLLLLLAALPSSQRRRHTDSPWRLLGLGVAGAAALVVAGSLLWTTAGVAGQGMKPALLPGDLVLVRRMPVEVRRGDVLAFRRPGGAEPRLARVVGLPGDAVAVEGGAPVIGGAPVLVSDDGWYEEVFGRQGPLGVMPVCGNGAVGFGATCRLKRALETLPGGRAYPVLDAGPRPLDRMEEVEVPSAHLFVLGDHRDAAQDSRLATAVGGTGLVPLGDVIGRVDLVLSSSAGAWAWDPRGWRWGRLLRVVP